MNQLHRHPVIIAIILILAAFMATAAKPIQAQAPGLCLTEDEKKFGMQLISLRPTAAGYMLDLRMKVIDAKKAAVPLSRKYKAYLTEQKSGKTLPVTVGKTGPLRQTTLGPKEGRIYFTLFANPGQVIKTGQIVDLTIGDLKMKGLRVQGPSEPPLARPTLNKDLSAKWAQLPGARQADLLNNLQTCAALCQNPNPCLTKCQQSFEDLLELEIISSGPKPDKPAAK